MFLFSGALVSVSGSGAIVKAQPHHLISNGVRQGRLRIYPVRTALRHQGSPPPRESFTVNHWQKVGYVDMLKSYRRHCVVSQDFSQDQCGQPRAALGHAYQ
jgi:hypothetical protein